jgi:radical SAM superfamily enzyme YgiQ (UPF0313 family)
MARAYLSFISRLTGIPRSRQMAIASHHSLRAGIAARLADETPLQNLRREAPIRLPLCYPSPYAVAMSSLGYQVALRLLCSGSQQVIGERAFLPDDPGAWQRARMPLVTYESLTPVSQAPAVFFSVAYELELTGLFTCLDLAGLPVLRDERPAASPLIICGGPLTFSNPLPLGPFADVVVIGEAEDVLPPLLERLLAASFGQGEGRAARDALLLALSREPGLWVPSVHGERLPPVSQCADRHLPASSVILTPNTELRSMFLIEPERGCSRGCTYCVMRRSTAGGMRLVPTETVAARLPAEATRVGLVGAAVTDHPRLPQILRHIVDERGLEVGISSLRADRLTDELVGLLARGGYRTLTVASDGASERMRVAIERRTKEKHLLRAAELARQHGMKTYKVYMMVGLPGETDDDIDELVRFTKELSRIVPTALGVAPFVAKRNTPLDGAPFAGVREVERRLERLRRGLSGHAEVRPTSARWAFVEYLLAQGGMEAGRRALLAHRAGGGFAAWRKAFADWEQGEVRRALRVVA